MDEEGSEGYSVSFCLKGLRGKAPSLGTLKDMLRKSPDAGISLHGGPFPPVGNLVCGRLLYRGL